MVPTKIGREVNKKFRNSGEKEQNNEKLRKDFFFMHLANY